MSRKVIAVFDIGKTNKKLLLFDEEYSVIFEKSARLEELKDEDGFPCENVQGLINFMYESLEEVMRYKYYQVVALNFSAYGASFVYVDAQGKVICPLYNYLKPYPEELKKRFYNNNGGEITLSKTTASPVLGSLNSGMQLYRLKYEKPETFKKISAALHLPQFLSYVFTKQAVSEITSVGCHTNLWNFIDNNYHEWVVKEDILAKLPPFMSAETAVSFRLDGQIIKAGTGLHDSSAALIPYLMCFKDPFVLVSTGTWCISLNPFNNTPLTAEELEQDVLCYLTYTGNLVKASRLLVGPLHEEQAKKIAAFFEVPVGSLYKMVFDSMWMPVVEKRKSEIKADFASISLREFGSATEAYHQLMYDIALLQEKAIRLVLRGSDVDTLFVDGGFSTNSLYMRMLAHLFPDMRIYATAMPQGSALGAALVMHAAWNETPMRSDLITLEAFQEKKLKV